MLIGIDGSRAFIKNRTGIEEYSYQVIDGLKKYLQNEQVVLYVREWQEAVMQNQQFDVPENWKIKTIKFPRFWTQLGLSLEMFLHPVDVLFVPAHTVPLIHPKNTVVTIHGLEYEFCPKAYSWWDRVYMRCSIKNSCSWASKIISVSENTKKDLMELYKVSENKIKVIYEGYDSQQSTVNSHQKKENLFMKDDRSRMTDDEFLLFVGRIEERKNIGNIIKAFEILKEKHGIAHKLVLAGKPGHGYQNIKFQISNAKCQGDIFELGFISDEEKWELLRKADCFVFPTLYEGFGIPVLEAQSVGCPVVASNNSSIPEVAKGSALLVDAQSAEDIAENIHKLISDEALKNAIIAKGQENVKRFSWDECANKIAEIIKK
ncbi:MAG: glycosyltransferase family 1 protein [Candidatus Moranbacteria bacterium]|nr:glycosyltransferase family 1 protein [Candidatus Moranbacteria bacterium]